MKGIVFTEFLDMVEAQFTPEVADRMITAAAVPSDGAYTAVGTYDYHEIIELVAQLSALTSLPVPKLLLAEGLIAGCIAHFGEAILVHRDDIANSHGIHVRFVLTKQDISA